MKDFLFLQDMVLILQHDPYYCDFKKLGHALNKCGLKTIGKSHNIEKMRHALAVHIIDQIGESEPFLTETFVEPGAIITHLKKQGLPVPASLRDQSANPDECRDLSSSAHFEELLDKVCRNCGTVSDPLGLTYKSPIGRLIFRTFLQTRLTEGINTTAHYVLEHLEQYDSDKIVTAIEDDYVTWKTDNGKEKMTSLYTIEKYILKFNRELQALL